MLTSFRDYLFGLLPNYFKANDSYKNSSDEGLLERYLRVFGLELDQYISPFIDNLFDIIDITKCDDKYLPLISGLLGYMPSFGTNSSYRKFLAYAIAIYKCKGTIVSFEIVYNILGYNVELIEEPTAPKYRYDDVFLYDADPNVIYDTDCAHCSNYRLVIAPLVSNPSFTINQTLIDLSNRIASFLQPIDAKFKGLLLKREPILISAIVNNGANDIIRLTFDRPLDILKIPDLTDFTFNASLPIEIIFVSSTLLTLKRSSSFVVGEVDTLDYTPSSNIDKRLQEVISAIEVLPIVNRSITNNVS